MFIIAGMIHFCGVIFYALFASGELQPWAEPEGTLTQPPPAPAALLPGQTQEQWAPDPNAQAVSKVATRVAVE